MQVVSVTIVIVFWYRLHKLLRYHRRRNEFLLANRNNRPWLTSSFAFVSSVSCTSGDDVSACTKRTRPCVVARGETSRRSSLVYTTRDWRAPPEPVAGCRVGQSEVRIARPWKPMVFVLPFTVVDCFCRSKNTKGSTVTNPPLLTRQFGIVSTSIKNFINIYLDFLSIQLSKKSKVKSQFTQDVIIV